MRPYVIGVMGPAMDALPEDLANARQLGARIAQRGWVLLSGGERAGVMEAVNEGAKQAGGLTVGIIPSTNARDASPYVDIAIVTGMGNARNAINALSSDVMVVCGMSAGTASEVALALREGKPVVLLTSNQAAVDFFTTLSPNVARRANTVEEAIDQIEDCLRAGEQIRPLDN